MPDHILTVDDSWRYGRQNFADKPELIQVHRDHSTLLNVKAGSATGFDLLHQYQEYREIGTHIEETGKGMRLKAALDNIERQLAPDQRVIVELDPETGGVRSIQRPGHPYMDDPAEISHFPAFVGGVACSVEPRETTQFKVIDETGAERTIVLDKEWDDKGRGDDDDGDKFRAPKRKSSDGLPQPTARDSGRLP